MCYKLTFQHTVDDLSRKMFDTIMKNTYNYDLFNMYLFFQIGLQEGYLELSTVRDIFIGGAVGRDRVKTDGASILRKYSLSNYSISECCLGLVYGTNTSENRIFYILAPPRLLR